MEVTLKGVTESCVRGYVTKMFCQKGSKQCDEFFSFVEQHWQLMDLLRIPKNMNILLDLCSNMQHSSGASLPALFHELVAYKVNQSSETEAEDLYLALSEIAEAFHSSKA